MIKFTKQGRAIKVKSNEGCSGTISYKKNCSGPRPRAFTMNFMRNLLRMVGRINYKSSSKFTLNLAKDLSRTLSQNKIKSDKNFFFEAHTRNLTICQISIDDYVGQLPRILFVMCRYSHKEESAKICHNFIWDAIRSPPTGILQESTEVEDLNKVRTCQGSLADIFVENPLKLCFVFFVTIST